MMGATILYAEDEATLAKLVCDGLINGGFEVHHAIDGKKAWTLAMQVNPDICILDVMMPEMDGFTLGQKIREKLPTVPIIYLTAKSESADVIVGFQSGGNDYIKKPFSMQELLVRLDNLLRLTQVRANTEVDIVDLITIGQFQYDRRKQELYHSGDHTHQLSHREHELLMLLYHAHHEIVERRDILNKIWGDDTFFNSRNLDVYIRKLRNYFEPDENVKIITLKGVGYRFHF